MKIETQNINVPASRFCQRMGIRQGETHLLGYAPIAVMEHEVMLNWYLDLPKQMIIQATGN
jgi:hypothetical protein